MAFAAFTIFAWTLLLPQPVGAENDPDLDIVSKYYIVIDAETGEVFAQRGAHDKVAPASLTKIFTSIEAIEEAPPDYQIITSEADLVELDATQVGFGPGETFTLNDLIFGMMLPSGNDAARAVARVMGTQEGDTAEVAVGRFIERVNQRLRDMGLTETNLVNPDGWGVPGHWSSAHDIAAFTMYALRYPRFVEAISTETYETSTGDYRFVNTNKRLGVDDDLIGGKTGYDDTAGYCLMQVARRGDDTMIAVTLDGVAPDVWYDDNRALLDYAFEQKAARGSSPGRGADVVRYLDPDAAVIVRMSTTSASIGPPGNLVRLSGEPAIDATAPLQPTIDPAIADHSVATTTQGYPATSANGLATAILVTVVLTGASALRLQRTDPTRYHPVN
ncbi:MAG TPA: serine hydrolase [Thermomicrobiales bacterium]|nr:serine hydrolase [Thermomicrobiales bacterium]